MLARLHKNEHPLTICTWLILSTLAISFGLDPKVYIQISVEPFQSDALANANDPGAEEFLNFINSWTRLTAVLNELSRAMGLIDFCPFVLSRGVVAKLHFVHSVIAQKQVQ